MNKNETIVNDKRKSTLGKHKFKKGNRAGVLFSKSNQPRNRGRKKSRMAEFIKAFGMDDQTRAISQEDAFKLMAHLLSCSKTQLEVMARNPDLPISIVCQIKAIITDMANGKTDTIDKLLDRVYGKSMQPMEITGGEGMPLIPEKPMSRKNYERLLSKLKCENQRIQKL